MHYLQKHKYIRMLLLVLLIGATLGVGGFTVSRAEALGTPSNSLGECIDGSTPGSTTANNGTVPLCADGSSPCKYGVDDSGTTPHCSPAPADNSSGNSPATCQDATGNDNGCTDSAITAAQNCPSGSTALSCTGIFTKFVDPLIKFLAIGVGVIVVVVIIIGGIQYATAGGNPQAVAAAHKRLFSAILALVVFALLYALLNWIVPGGVPKP
jgi:hypothetical protein